MVASEKANTRRNLLTIAIHILGWIGFYILTIVSSPEFHENKQLDILPRLLYTLEIVIFFYINYFILMPKLFTKRKFAYYIVLVLVLAFIFSVLGELIFSLRHMFSHAPGMMPGQDPDMMNGPRPEMRHGPPPFSMFRGLSVYFLVLVVSSAIRVTQEWLKNERQKKELENDKLKAELASLKSQINPHFIFNVLNNICSLARKKSDQTEEVIIKLSQLLRYNLYNFEDDKVFLDEEIQYIRDYIDIQKIRLQDNVQINFEVKGNTEGVRIEPLLFMPFIENAFKHGVNNIKKDTIGLFIETFPGTVHFYIKNSFIENTRQKEKYEGRGLNNAYRRLNLLYPSQHVLHMVTEKPDFIVDLIIRLND